LINNQNCFLASTPLELANAANRLMADNEVAKQQLIQAQKTVKEHDFDLVAERILSIFKELK